MVAVTIFSQWGCLSPFLGTQENKMSWFPFFPHVFAMKWWNQMPWSQFFWMLSFKPAFTLSSFSLITSVQFSYSFMSDSATSWTAVRQASFSITNSWSYSNSCPLFQWCHPTISSSVIPFSSHLQCFPASGSFPMSQFFTSGGQNIGVSASASVLPMNIQDWFPLGWTGWISLQSKGLSRVFCNTTV